MLIRQREAAVGSVSSVRAALGAVLSLPSALLVMVGEALARRWAADARRAELRAHSVAQLRELCVQHGRRKTGAKAERVARLCDALCTETWSKTMARVTAASAEYESAAPAESVTDYSTEESESE